jgi:hypothetical protein
MGADVYAQRSLKIACHLWDGTESALILSNRERKNLYELPESIWPFEVSMRECQDSARAMKLAA